MRNFKQWLAENYLMDVAPPSITSRQSAGGFYYNNLISFSLALPTDFFLDSGVGKKLGFEMACQGFYYVPKLDKVYVEAAYENDSRAYGATSTMTEVSFRVYVKADAEGKVNRYPLNHPVIKYELQDLIREEILYAKLDIMYSKSLDIYKFTLTQEEGEV